MADHSRDWSAHLSGVWSPAMLGSRKLGLTSAALMVLTVVVFTFAPGPASAEHEQVPVFVIGIDDGLNPALIRRNSEEFREVIFPPIAKALARGGFRVFGEEPFRARFNVDGVAGERLSRWESLDFFHHARQVAVDEAGNTAPYLVLVDVWERTCRDDMTQVCLNIGAQLHDVDSGEPVFGTGPPEIRIPIPTDCEGDCLWRLWHAQSEALLHPIGAALAQFMSDHLTHGTSRAGG